MMVRLAQTTDLALSRRTFLRAPLSDLQGVLASAERSLRISGHIQFVAFWGAGFKRIAQSEDIRALAHIVHLGATIGARLEVPTRLTLLLADSHASLNSIPKALSEPYLASITALAAAFRADTERLSSFYTACSDFESVELPVQALKSMARHIRAASRFRAGEASQEGAIRYLKLRLWERSIISKRFPDAILLSGDRPSDSYILPDLPTIFFYVGGPGDNHKPWLAAEDNAKCAG